MKKSCLQTIILVQIAFLCVSCMDKKTPPPKKVPAKPEMNFVQRGLTLDLVDYFPVASIYRCPSRIVFTESDQEQYVVSGWNSLEPTAEGKGRCWTKQGPAIVEIPRATTSSLTLLMKLTPPVRPNDLLPEQTLRVLWNNKHVKTIALGFKHGEYEIPIPEDLQHYGLNRLALYPRYTFNLKSQQPDADSRDIGVLCSGIDFMGAREMIADTVMAATVEGDSIIQLPESLISYHFVLPKNPELHGQLMLRSPESDKPKDFDGYAVLSVLNADGREEVLLKKSLKEISDSGKISFGGSLSKWAEQMISVNLCFSLTTKDKGTLQTASLPRLEWKGVRIEGIQEDLLDSSMKDYRKHYNIVLMIFDSLRADRTEPYGCTSVQTPNMNQLAAQGTTFVNAYSNASWTRTSVATLLTSLYPWVHKTLAFRDTFSTEVPCIQQILTEVGYDTICMSNNGNISPRQNYDRGFGDFLNIWEIEDFKTANDQAKVAWETYIRPFLIKHHDRPFFLYIHERDPHAPYDPPPPL